MEWTWHPAIKSTIVERMSSTNILDAISPRRFYQSTVALAKQVFARFNEIGGSLISAGIAFYAFLSAAPLAVIAVAMAGVLFGEEAARGEIEGRLVSYLGAEAASLVNRLILSSHHSGERFWASIVSLALIAFAASRLFAEMERALNIVWGVKVVKPDDLKNKTKLLVKRRIRSFVFVFTASSALIVVLVGKMLTDAVLAFAPGAFFSQPLIVDILQFCGLIMTLTGFNTVVFRTLPHIDLEWREVMLGAFVTAVLVAIGSLLAGIYTRHASLSSTYGAAGTFVLILLWAYYSSQVFVLGAVFTCLWSANDSPSVPEVRKP